MPLKVAEKETLYYHGKYYFKSEIGAFMSNNKKILLAGILVMVIIFIVGCSLVKGHNNAKVDAVVKEISDNYVEDNYLEESIEDQIQKYTGFDLDLSPCSPEEIERNDD